MARNPALKQRSIAERPYMTWRSGDWTWDVLKCWQVHNDRPGARWFCKVTTPMTEPGFDLGDVYVHDIVGVGHAVLTDWDLDVWPTRAELTAFIGTPSPIAELF